MGLWGNPEFNEGQEQRNQQWAKTMYDIHESLIKSGFSVDQAFELVKIELAHTYRIMEVREEAKLRANPGR